MSSRSITPKVELDSRTDSQGMSSAQRGWERSTRLRPLLSPFRNEFVEFETIDQHASRTSVSAASSWQTHDGQVASIYQPIDRVDGTAGIETRLLAGQKAWSHHLVTHVSS